MVIDDDPFFRAVAVALLQSRGYRTAEQEEIDPDLLAGLAPVPDVLLLDRHLRAVDAHDRLPALRDALPRTPIILITADTSLDASEQATSLGAFDFHPKPIDEARLLASIHHALEHARLARRIESLQAVEPTEFEGIVGASRAMRTVFSIIDNVAPTEAPVMILGASGTGKELVARAIHRRSARSQGPFVAINVSAIPDDLTESTLFGHERGAFTGADRTRHGAVEQAAGGTLFLDEIGEMPLDMQPKLLRFLQERTYRRVGGQSELNADVRLISATNRDPLAAVRDGRLRSDLYYRLNVVPVTLAPLAQREGDVPILARRFLRDAAERHGRAFKNLHPEAMAALESASWPGNVRQLQHVIERAVVLHDADTLTREMLDPASGSPLRDAPPSAPNGSHAISGVSVVADGGAIIPIAELERRAIMHAIETLGSPARAAVALGISEATIYRKLRRYRKDGRAP